MKKMVYLLSKTFLYVVYSDMACPYIFIVGMAQFPSCMSVGLLPPLPVVDKPFCLKDGSCQRLM